MKVAVIAGYAPSLINFRGPLLATLTDAGHTVVACAPEEDNAVSTALSAMGVIYRPIPLGRGGMNPLQEIGTLVGLYRFFREEQPDLALGYTVKPVIYGSLAARLAGVPAYFSMITGLGYAFTDSGSGNGDRGKRGLLGGVIKMLYRPALASNRAVFFQNLDDRALFVHLGLVDADKTVIINGSGIDLRRFAFSPPKPDEGMTFLLIARLLKDKGIAEYATAAAQLRRQYPQARFQLLGGLDPENPAAIDAAQLAAWQQTGAISYLGVTDDVRPFLADAHVYVLPSYREGTPRTVLEALAIGRPIITTDAPGCRETVIEGENGFLVPPRDAQALAEAMERFILHPELIAPMGKRSRALAEQKYDVQSVNATILQTMGLLN